MEPQKVKFGTDGWRGVIADDYTFDNVRACAQGVAAYHQAQGLDGRPIVVGYDTRFASADFAAAAAEVLMGNGFPVILCDKPAERNDEAKVQDLLQHLQAVARDETYVGPGGERKQMAGVGGQCRSAPDDNPHRIPVLIGCPKIPAVSPGPPGVKQCPTQSMGKPGREQQRLSWQFMIGQFARLNFHFANTVQRPVNPLDLEELGSEFAPGQQSHPVQVDECRPSRTREARFSE
jgi:hypothetical protein